eukprot:13482613-Alexandrium_andersonii.AAC.1
MTCVPNWASETSARKGCAPLPWPPPSSSLGLDGANWASQPSARAVASLSPAGARPSHQWM